MEMCRRFSKAAAAAAQRQECIAISAIFSEERGTESGGLWDAGGPNSATLSLSLLSLVYPKHKTGISFFEDSNTTGAQLLFISRAGL